MRMRAVLPASALRRSLSISAQQSLAQVQRGDQQPLELLLDRVARQFVEQPGEVAPDLVVDGEQAEVLVDAAGLGVVVAGADVAVVTQHAVLLADDERELAVRLEADEAVDDVHAGLLELARPHDVRRFVESRLDLDEGQHLLAGLRRVDQRLHDRAVARRAVQRLLDGEHVRIARRLLEEALHARRERLVRVVDQHVALADRGEEVGAAVLLGRLERDRGRRARAAGSAARDDRSSRGRTVRAGRAVRGGDRPPAR